MRIQHNIAAMNAYRNYNNNTSALSKNLEKLSSGYKINRAGDDAAGLAISEKMRAQITGLNAAQKNVKDGVSLVKTAEGAMQEIQDMLNRMDYLATQSANGTYDNEVDRANLQKEVDALKTEINRIADSANFNGIKLLDGSLDSSKVASDAVVETVTGEKANVAILQEAATDPTGEVGDKTVLREGTPTQGKTVIQMELGDVALMGQNGDKFTVTVGDKKIELEVGAGKDLEADKEYKGKDLADAIVAAFRNGDQKISGQEFKVSVVDNKNDNYSVKFEQLNEPTSNKEVVGANVGVKFSHTPSPNGQAAEYTVEIAKDAIKAGDKLTINGMDVNVTLTGDLETDLAANNNVKAGDYEVSYANGKLTIKDPDGTLGAPTVSYDSYTAAARLEGTKTAGTDPVKGEYSVQVTSGGAYKGAATAVYKAAVTSDGNFSGAAKATYESTIALDTTGGKTIEAGNTIKIGTGTAWTVVADATTTLNANEVKVSDVTDSWLAQRVAEEYNNGVSPAYTATANGSKVTYEANGAGALNSAGAPTAAPSAATITIAAGTGSNGANLATSTEAVNNTAVVTGKDADEITVGGVTLTVGDATDVAANKISADDANDAAKLAKVLAQALTDSDYNVTAEGSNLVYTAQTAGKINGNGPANAPANLTVTGTAAGAATIAGFGNAATEGRDADKITIGGQDIVIGEDISAEDARDSDKLAEVIAEKLNGNVLSDYKVTSDGNNLVFTAIKGGEVKADATGGVPTAAPDVTAADLAVTITDGSGAAVAGGTLTLAAAKETTKGTDATKAYTEYDLSSLKEGDIVEVDGKTFVVPDGGLTANTQNKDGNGTFAQAVANSAGLGAATQVTVSNKGILKVEANQGGKDSAAPNPKITVQSKETTEAEVVAPERQGAITGTWNVQSTVNATGGSPAASPLASTAFTLDKSIVNDDQTLTIGNTTYRFKVGAESTATAGDGEVLIDLSAYEADSNNLIKAAAQALANDTKNSAFTIGYDEGASTADAAKITIHEKLGQTDFDKELQSIEEFDKLVYTTKAAYEKTTQEATEGGKALMLQIGDTSDSFNQMKVSVGDMHVSAMKLTDEETGESTSIADIDISTQDGAAKAVDVIKNAINYVSSVRGDLGAIQNRLDHTGNNLSVMAENIQDAESTIRDTDVAEEMMSYVKNNILVQSAQAMLAQANQLPQGVLQLLG